MHSCLLDFIIALHGFHFCAVNGINRMRGAPSAYSRASIFSEFLGPQIYTLTTAWPEKARRVGVAITNANINLNNRLEMWANVQRDGRPAEYNGALCSTPQSLADAHGVSLPCSNAAKTRNLLKYAWVHKLLQFCVCTSNDL